MDSELDYSLSQPLGLLCIGQCFSQCWWKQMFLQWAAQFGSARPLRGLLYRSLTFFYRCLKYLPDLVKTRALQKANVSLLPLHVFWQLKTSFCYFERASPCLVLYFLVKTWILRTLLMQVEPEWTKASLRFERERVQAYEHQVFPFSLAFFHFHPLIHQQRNENKKFLSVFFHFLLLLNAPLKKL